MVRIAYTFNKSLLELTEAADGNDFEFTIVLLRKELKKGIEKVREYFEENDILTDIHFYIHTHDKYQIIVRNDFYNELLIQLFRQQLLDEIKWVN